MNSECPFKDGQRAILNCKKFKLMTLNERREHVQKFELFFNCLQPGHQSKDCKSRTWSVPNCGRQHNNLLHSEFSKKEAETGGSDATTAVATNIPQGVLPVVRIKVVNGNYHLSVLAILDTGSPFFCG